MTTDSLKPLKRRIAPTGTMPPKGPETSPLKKCKHCEACSEDRHEGCIHGMCGLKTCGGCQTAQSAQGLPCQVHEPPEDEAEADDGASDAETVTEALDLPANFKLLNSTNPKLISCAYSMLDLQQRTAGAAELLDRKVDLWLTTHSRFKRDADEVEHLRSIALATLTSPLVSTRPNELGPILSPTLRRLFSHVFIRPKYGTEGMEAYEAKLRAVDEDPEGHSEALLAAVSAFERGQRRGRGRTEGGG